MGKQRILWIDCLKGIGILSVVFVHITGRMALFVYAIPLFFMLSGYLFHKQPIAGYAIKTARRMVMPYIVFLLIISSLVYGQEITKMGGVILRGGVALTAELGTFWFSGVLFLTLMLFNLMSEGIRAWVCIAAFVVANLVNHFELFLPLNIQAVPIALFYMTAGNIIKKYLPTSEFGRIVEEKINPIAIGIIAVLGVVILALPDVFLDIKYNNYGIPVVSILLSLVMVAIVAVLCVRIAKVPVIGKFLAFCGKASLFIMFVHQYVHFRIFASQGRLITLFGTIALSLLLYIAAMRWRTTRLMLCGEIKK